MISGAVRSAAKSILYHAGAYHLRLSMARRRRPGRRLLILVYHNLADPGSVSDRERRVFEIRPVLPVETLACHLRVLHRHFRVVSLEQGARELRESPEINEISVAITFDDGYRSFLTCAVPLLKEYGFPATVFLPTDYIDAPHPFWWDELTQILIDVNSAERLAAACREPLGLTLPPPTTGDALDLPAKSRYLDIMEHRLAALSHADRLKQFEQLKAKLEPGPSLKHDPLPMLSWEDIRGLSRQGFSFGAHTGSHMNLADAPIDLASAEIERSTDRIAEELGSRSPLFAYPYGDAPDRYVHTLPVLEEFGVQFARTTRAGLNTAATEPLLLCRADVAEYSSEWQVHVDVLRAAAG